MLFTILIRTPVESYYFYYPLNYSEQMANIVYF